MPTHTVAAIAGDGIGKEVIPVGMHVLNTACRLTGEVELAFEELPWGSDYFLETGYVMPPDAASILREYDAIYLGAMGSPDVPDHVTSGEGQLRIRRELDLYVNVRPIELFAGVQSPLRNASAGDIDLVCVRENSEGEYSGAGGRAHAGTAQEVAIQTSIFTRTSIERIARFAFELARTRRKLVTSVTKSNALAHAFLLWDETVEAVADEFPEVTLEHVYADAAAAYLVTRPEAFDVLLASNLFGDVLTDLGSAVQGSIGLAASANLNSMQDIPGMFEPAHGSAPDIAGRGVANPIGAVWSGALLLGDLGYPETAARIMGAVRHVLQVGAARTADLGGVASTLEAGQAIEKALVEHPTSDR